MKQKNDDAENMKKCDTAEVPEETSKDISIFDDIILIDTIMVSNEEEDSVYLPFVIRKLTQKRKTCQYLYSKYITVCSDCAREVRLSPIHSNIGLVASSNNVLFKNQ